MCLFEMRVILCGCEDPACKQAEPELAGFLEQPGHVIKINWYYRRGPQCLGYFLNRDPERLVLRLGMDPDNTNAKMDCHNKVIKIEEDPERTILICGDCDRLCEK